jgi:hypothetical protein
VFTQRKRLRCAFVIHSLVIEKNICPKINEIREIRFAYLAFDLSLCPPMSQATDHRLPLAFSRS